MFFIRIKKKVLLGIAAIFIAVSFAINLLHHYGHRRRDWDFMVSRNMADYINTRLQPHILPRSFCAEKTMVVVMICSRPEAFDNRLAIRETWGKQWYNISFYFLLGKPKKNARRLDEQIEIESNYYKDIVQERFVDSYHNLTFKSVYMLKLFTLHCANSSKFLLKIDDDVFLNTILLLDWLYNQTRTTNLLQGKIIKDTKPFRHPGHKWFVPYEWYLDIKYPDYLCGSTYLMSADVAVKLYATAMETPWFFIEDVFVTGICAQKANVTPTPNKYFSCMKRYSDSDVCAMRRHFCFHYFEPENMRNMFSYMRGNVECPQPVFWLRIWSIF